MSKQQLPKSWRWAVVAALVVGVTGLWSGIAPAAWQPTKSVEFVVPAGTGGGADIMARFISPLIEKHKLSPHPFIVVNRSGGAGAEAKGESLTGDGMCLPATLLPLRLKGSRHRTAGQRRYFSQVSTGEYLPSTRTCGPVSSTRHF